MFHFCLTHGKNVYVARVALEQLGVISILLKRGRYLIPKRRIMSLSRRRGSPGW